MQITADTKISVILKQNIEAIEAIAKVNPNFEKLRNPFLRKLFAGRVTVADAARIGGTTADMILKSLEEIGFKVKYNQFKENQIITPMSNHIKPHTISMDVRPILDAGTDPFHAIIETLKTLNSGDTLLVINSFEPVPLLNKLSSEGYTYTVERHENAVYSYLTKPEASNASAPVHTDLREDSDFETVENAFTGKMTEIDVRDLEMPMPMVTILQELELLPEGHALYVNHKRLPQYLIPELQSRGWVYASKEIDEANMKFIIFKTK